MITPVQRARLASWNQGNAASAEVPLLLDRTVKVVARTWNFATQGGAHASADIDLGYIFEEASIVSEILMQVIVAPAGASSTYTIEAGATLLSNPIAVGSMVTGAMALVGGATAIAVAAGTSLQLNIGTANATAGSVRFYIHILPQRDM